MRIKTELAELQIQPRQTTTVFGKRILQTEKKNADLENWLLSLQTQIAGLKPDNDEVKAKLKLLQEGLQHALADQAKQKTQQAHNQKQIATLRSQIDAVNDVKNIQPLEEKIKSHEEDLLKLKKSFEQVAKSISSNLRTQIQSLIEDSGRQAEQFTRWKQEFEDQLGQQNKQQESLLTELQTQLSQNKTAIAKRLEVLEKRVASLEAKHDALVAKTDAKSPAFTLAQKLLKIRQIVLDDKDITNELQYYVPPNGESGPGKGDHQPLYQWVQQNLLDPKAEARLLLLQGQAGAGKSTFNRFLWRELWRNKAWESFKPGGPVPKAYVPFFIPLGHTKVDPKNLFNSLFVGFETYVEFTSDETIKLKEDYQLLLIADGYDEMPGNPELNLYDVNELYKYQGCVKLLISCRTQRWQELDEETYFIPKKKDKEVSHYKSRSISPFDDKQLASYIEKYLEKNKETKDMALWPDVVTYLKHIDTFPDLKNLINKPFLLMIAVKVLPLIIAQAEKDSKESADSKTIHLGQMSLTKAKLYDKFIARWFETQADKADKACELPKGKGKKDIKDEYQEFCFKLALHLKKAHRAEVEYPWKKDSPDNETKNDLGPRGAWVEELFGDKDTKWVRGRKGAPLRKGTSNNYSFIHASFIDYFFTKYVTLLTENSDRANTGSDIDKDTLLLLQKLTRDEISFFADQVIENEKFKTYLFRIIERSKNPEEVDNITGAAASAITILKIAGISFSDRDFRGVRIPCADLSGAILDSVDFSNADLSNVNFTGTWLRQANFTKARMTGVQFGERPYLEVPDGASVCCYSSNKKWFAVAGGSCIYLYEISERNSEFQCRFILIGHQAALGDVYALVFRPDGRELASGSEDRTIRLWDVASGRCTKVLKGHKHSVITLGYSPDGRELVSGGNDKTIRMWDVVTGRCIRELQGFKEGVSDLSYCPDGREFAFAIDAKSFAGNNVYLWNLSTRSTRILAGHLKPVRAICYSPDGRELASESEDNTVRLWDTAAGHCTRVLEGNVTDKYGGGFDLCYSSDGQKLLSLSGSSYERRIVKLWDVATGNCIYTFERSGIISVRFHPNRDELTASGKMVYFLNLKNEIFTRMPTRHSSWIRALSHSSSGKELLSESEGIVYRWDVAMGRFIDKYELKLKYTHIKHIMHFPKKNEFILHVSENYDAPDNVYLWNLNTGECKRLFTPGRGKSINAISYRSDGKEFAYGISEYTSNKHVHTVHLWDVSSSRLTSVLKGHKDNISVLCYRPDGLQLASGSHDETIRIWNLVTGTCIRVLNGKDWITILNYRPDSQELASTGHDHTIRLWNTDTGRCRKLEKLDCTQRVLSYSPDGRFLASSSVDRSVRLWDTEKGKCLGEFSAGYVDAISWSITKEGIFIATGSDDASVRYWQVCEEKDKTYRVVLRWASQPAVLNLSKAIVKDADIKDTDRVSSKEIYKIFQQRGAITEPRDLKTDEITSAPKNVGNRLATITSSVVPVIGAVADHFATMHDLPSLPELPESLSKGISATSEKVKKTLARKASHEIITIDLTPTSSAVTKSTLDSSKSTQEQKSQVDTDKESSHEPGSNPELTTLEKAIALDEEEPSKEAEKSPRLVSTLFSAPRSPSTQTSTPTSSSVTLTTNPVLPKTPATTPSAKKSGSSVVALAARFGAVTSNTVSVAASSSDARSVLQTQQL